MIDYSVRMRCQGSTILGEHCKRRGYYWQEYLGWYCWQHDPELLHLKGRDDEIGLWCAKRQVV